MPSSIYDTKHLFLTDLVNARAYLNMYITELLYKIMKRKEIYKIKICKNKKK